MVGIVVATIGPLLVGSIPIAACPMVGVLLARIHVLMGGRDLGPPPTIPTMGSQPHIPSSMHGNYIPTNNDTITGPSRDNLGSNLPYMAHLKLPYLARLMNDPISHQPHWPPMPTKLSSDIPKFEGKAGEDPQNHIMSFHLWFSSNNIVDDSVRLRLLQCTLTSVVEKGYIKLLDASYPDLFSLASMFLQ